MTTGNTRCIKSAPAHRSSTARRTKQALNVVPMTLTRESIGKRLAAFSYRLWVLKRQVEHPSSSRSVVPNGGEGRNCAIE